MEEQYIVPGTEWNDETGSEEQRLSPDGDWIDSDAAPTPPGPGGGRRRPVIICGG